MTEIETLAEILEAAGLTVHEWRGTRLYIRDRGRELGYLVDGDDGSTGTCRHLHSRRGWLCQIIRVGLEEMAQ